MRATLEDFEKVFDVVREQVRRALDKVPDTFDSLHTHLNGLTYQEITNLRHQERTNREEWELQVVLCSYYNFCCDIPLGSVFVTNKFINSLG